MQENTSNSKITDSCPRGHHVRGDISLAGKTVRCPKCSTMFVFAPLKPANSENTSVTDTGVMRILGEASTLPPVPEKKAPSTRPCPRCSVTISSNASVCNHCSCYVGVMPRFMTEMTKDDSGFFRRA